MSILSFFKSPRRHRIFFLMLLAVILFGLLLRTWKLSFALPWVWYMDEGFHVYFALNMGGGDLNPHMFLKPTLFFYLCFFVDVILILAGKMLGYFQEFGEAWELYRRDPTLFFLAARGVSVFFGVLTLPVVYEIGKRSFDQRTGIISVLFLTCAFLHIQYSQIAYLEATLTFFVVLCLYLTVWAYQSGRVGIFVLAGLAGGLSLSTKYSGLPTLVLGPLAAFLWALQHQRNPIPGVVGKRSILFFIGVLAGFTIGTPYWILDFTAFKNDFFTLLGFYQSGGSGQLGYDGGWNWLYYLAEPLRYGLGLPLELLGGVGFLALALRRRAAGFLFLTFPVIYFLIAGSSEIRRPHYALPIIPFFCIAGAVLLVWAVRRLRFKKLIFERAFILVASFLIISTTLFQSLRYLYLKQFPETRILAKAWIEQNASRGDRMLQTFYVFLSKEGAFETTRLDPTVFDTRQGNRSFVKSIEEYRSEGFDYLLLDEWHTGLILSGTEGLSKYEFQRKKYRDFLRDLEENAELVAEFLPYPEGKEVPFTPENVEFTAHYLWKLERLGPPIRIYRL